MDIAGVTWIALKAHTDDRGLFMEIFRDAWVGQRPLQWNHARSNKGVLRGVHAHCRNTDYVVLLEGLAIVGLRDLRPNSPTYGESGTAELRADNPCMLTIPPGVAHGFYFPEAAAIIFGVTHYWDVNDELGCRWDDPALRIHWPSAAAQTSAKDAALPPFAAFSARMHERLSEV